MSLPALLMAPLLVMQSVAVKLRLRFAVAPVKPWQSACGKLGCNEPTMPIHYVVAVMLAALTPGSVETAKNVPEFIKLPPSVSAEALSITVTP
jgi:hypothetical protein